MANFYPKKSVLRRSQLLLLLIFLEVVFDCTGGSRGPGVHAAVLGWRERGGYGRWGRTRRWGYQASCKGDSSCRQDLVCDSYRKVCVCRNSISDKLVQVYDRTVGKCMSAVGKLCTLGHVNDGLPTLDCVRHAECVRPVGAQLASLFGLCQCQPGWEETEEHLCRESVVIGVGDGDPNVTSLAQKQVGLEGGVPIEDDMMPMPTSSKENNEIVGDDKKDSRIPVKVKVLTSSTPKNPNEGIDVPKSVLDHWVDFDFLKKRSPKAHTSNGGSTKRIVAPIVIVLIHAFAILFQG